MSASELAVVMVDREDDARARKEAETALRRNAAWLAGQKEAFQAAVNGAPLKESLDVLIRTATAQFDGHVRCAFYIADLTGRALRHVTGMSQDYADCINSFVVGPESLACGLAAHRAEPVITHDVREDPQWADWLWLAEKYDYRSCWSFPIETSERRVVGTFAMYHREPCLPRPHDLDLASVLTHAASIIVSRHEAQTALVKSEQSLASDLAATQQLQTISTLLIQEGNVDALYHQIVVAATKVMGSDFASLQVADDDRRGLKLLSHIGFDPESEQAWQFVLDDAATSCAHALRDRNRAIVTDVETCDEILSSPEILNFRRAGIRSMQSTPLIARSGKFIGMISTHWKAPHEPSRRDLRLFDVLARQAADLLERNHAEEMLRRRAAQLRLMVDELDHRVKNTLVTVQSITVQTLRNAATVEEGLEALESRLVALAKAHDVLTREHWQGADMLETVKGAISPYTDAGHTSRFEIEGPNLKLRPKAVLALSIALNELATNATKYGALSNGDGKVSIQWDIAIQEADRFHFAWRESGGPTVTPPTRRGFGTRLIERGLSRDIGGEVELDFPDSGLICSIDAPANEIRSAAV